MGEHVTYSDHMYCAIWLRTRFSLLTHWECANNPLQCSCSPLKFHSLCVSTSGVSQYFQGCNPSILTAAIPVLWLKFNCSLLNCPCFDVFAYCRRQDVKHQIAVWDLNLWCGENNSNHMCIFSASEVMYYKWPGEITGVMCYIWSEKTEKTLIISVGAVN